MTTPREHTMGCKPLADGPTDFEKLLAGRRVDDALRDPDVRRWIRVWHRSKWVPTEALKACGCYEEKL
jgi:hypothetical protein